jgi:DNA-binding protein H-NS
MRATNVVRLAGLALIAAVPCLLPGTCARGEEAPEGLRPVEPKESTAKWAPAVKPKPLSENVQQGLAWLVKTQLPNGSWGQGEESQNMGNSMEQIRSSPNVADTCMAALALIRGGNTPKEGPHAGPVRRAIEFVCGEIEQSDRDSLLITNLKGTRTQGKLGQYIDTFLASMLLAEVREQMADEAGTKRVQAAFHKVMDKIERNQKKDGTWDGQGWAPVLQQAMGAKALNRAAQSGYEVDEQVRAKVEKFAGAQFETKESGKMELAKAPAPATAAFVSESGSDARAPARSPAAGSAGVDLYAWAANLGSLRDQDNTNKDKEDDLRDRLKNASSDEERAEIEATLSRYDENRKKLQAAQTSLTQRLDDARFVQGFGSNGGEEFLSYMNIGESLVVSGGEAWESWDKKITENLNRIQNQDGSWTGHHCITGRTFCTSAALLVLTVDRAPVPVAAKIGRR